MRRKPDYSESSLLRSRFAAGEPRLFFVPLIAEGIFCKGAQNNINGCSRGHGRMDSSVELHHDQCWLDPEMHNQPTAFTAAIGTR
jgi:hypothetical protein